MSQLIYAVGDIHGMYTPLANLIGKIKTDSDNYPSSWSKVLVFVGDYIDRGPMSRAVIDFVRSKPLSMHSFRTIALKGNHEDLLEDYYAGIDRETWLANGGNATRENYARGEVTKRDRAWIGRLKLFVCLGRYAFVHAGFHPEREIQDQSEEDLLWIRDPFLSYEGQFLYNGHPMIVVHGHSPHDAPVVTGNRICIDTGACYTGVLTAVALDGGEPRFLQSCTSLDPSSNEALGVGTS